MRHFRSKWRKCQNSIARPQAVHSEQSEFKQAAGLPVVPQARLQAEFRVLVKTDTQKKKKAAPAGDRTFDLQIKSPMLYRLS